MKLKPLIHQLVFVLFLFTQLAGAQTPRRAMVLVFDQMRAEYIDRFDMKNFKRARAMGLQFDNGIVGHLESNTIVSHPVITTGKLPKNLPWGTHIMKDTRGLLGAKDAFYTPFLLTPKQWMDLHRQTSGDISLPERIRKKYKGPSLAVAQKKYAAFNFGGPYIDTVVCLDSAFKSGPWKGYHNVGGRHVPSYILDPVGNRFYVPGTSDWGSQNEVYRFHGNSFVTGNDPKRPGGDAWVGDVVEKFMQHEPEWSVILASFGSIDKVSHVLAEHDGPTDKEWAIKNKISLKEATRKADIELGRILDRLETQGLDKETVILITADHGGQHSKHFHGHTYPDAHLDNLWIGLRENENLPLTVQALADTGVIEMASINTVMSFWTRKMSSKERLNFLGTLALTAGVAEIYEKVHYGGQTQYQLEWQNKNLKGPERRWAQQLHPKLVDSLASDTGPQFIALLFDQHGYDVPGSHGGAQELVQRIPYILISPNLKTQGERSLEWARLVDVNPIIGKVMGLPDHPRLDGSYEVVESWLK